LSAFEVIRILIGPAIGIEKMNPANNPAIDIVKILSAIKPGYYGRRLFKINTQGGIKYSYVLNLM